MTHADVTSEAIRTALSNVRVSMPCVVTAVNGKTIDARPLIKVNTLDGKKSMPNLHNIPVVQPASGGFSISFPIKVGDECMVIFQDRAIDAWSHTGEDSEEVEPRNHHLSDGIAIIGLASAAKSGITTGGTTSGGMEISGYGNTMIFGTDGKINITSGNVIVTGCDVIADGISLKTHTHTGDSGGTTSAPN